MGRVCFRFGSSQAASDTGTATPRQIEFVRVLASQIRGLGVRRLDTVTETLCGKPLAGLSHAEASALIDVLKNVRAGKLALDAVLKGAAA